MTLIDPPGRQGPGPLAHDAVARLDLRIARRAGGPLPGERRAPGVGVGHRARPAAPVRAGRRPAPARPGRQRADRHPARPPARARARADDLDRARPERVDGVRDRPAPEVRRRRGRRLDRRAARRAPRRPRRRRHRRRARERDAAAPLGPPRLRRREAAGRRGRRTRRGPRPGWRCPPRSNASAASPAPAAWSPSSRTSATTDGRRRCARSPSATRVTAIEITDPRETELPDAGHLVLLDPETGRTVEADTASPAGPRRVRRRRGGAPRRGRRRDPRRPRAPRDAVHRRRLAARARAGAAMTFAAPAHLLALLALPLVALAYAIARNRRRRYAVRFPATAVFARVAGGQPRLRRVAPAGAARGGRGGVRGRARQARGDRSRCPVEKASVVLVTDESGSMSATDVDPSRLAAAQSAARTFLGRVPEVAAGRLRRVLVADEHGRRAHARPRRGARPRSRACAPTAGPPPATRSARRSTASRRAAARTAGARRPR